MKNLKELEKKYEELGKEIENLKKEQEQENDISKDPIFLLSIEEYKKYRNKIPPINTWWWLRSPASASLFPNDITVISCNGFVEGLSINVRCSSTAIRPALRLNQRLCFRYDKNKIIYCGITWVEIDEGLYIAEVPIDFRRFDESSDDYTTSEIRKFLLGWYKKRKDY